MRNSIRRGLLLVAALTASSCLSCPPAFQRVNVRTEPAGADIFLDGDLVKKKTPAGLEMSTLQDHKVYLKKEGYRPELVVVERKRTKDGVVYLSPPDISVALQSLASEGLDRPPATTEGGSERKKTEEELERERRLRIEMEKSDKPEQPGEPR